jgi:hypothetical protein
VRDERAAYRGGHDLQVESSGYLALNLSFANGPRRWLGASLHPMVASLIAYSVSAFASATTGAALPVD